MLIPKGGEILEKQELSDLIVRDVMFSGRIHTAAQSSQQKHDRERWAVVLKIEGKTVYRYEGKERISDATHPVILGAGSHYEWECMESGDFLIVEFTCDRAGGTLFGFDLPDNSEFVKNFLRIEKNRAAAPTARKLKDKQYLYAILASLLGAQTPRYANSEKYDRLAPAVTYLTQRYSDRDISIGKLAAMCGISEVYFRKLFTDLYGVSPIRYLQNLRIDKAKDMLRSDHGSIGAIAQSVGYSDIYQFSKAFRRATGLSPSRYGK